MPVRFSLFEGSDDQHRGFPRIVHQNWEMGKLGLGAG